MTEATVTPIVPGPETAKAKTQDLMRAAYTEATAQLREAHRAEFNTLLAAAAKAKGVEWKPRPTAEEREAAKRQAELDKARAEFEKAQAKLAALVGEPEGDAQQAMAEANDE